MWNKLYSSIITPHLRCRVFGFHVFILFSDIVSNFMFLFEQIYRRIPHRIQKGNIPHSQARNTLQNDVWTWKYFNTMLRKTITNSNFWIQITFSFCVYTIHNSFSIFEQKCSSNKALYKKNWWHIIERKFYPLQILFWIFFCTTFNSARKSQKLKVPFFLKFWTSASFPLLYSEIFPSSSTASRSTYCALQVAIFTFFDSVGNFFINSLKMLEKKNTKFWF